MLGPDMPRVRRFVRRLRPDRRGARPGRLPQATRHQRPSLAQAAKEAGWIENEATASLLSALDAALVSARRPPRIAVLNGPGGQRFGVIISAHRPRAKVLALEHTMDDSAMHAALAAAGPLDLIVDDSRTHTGRADRFLRLFLHLRPGGAYLVNELGGEVAEPEGTEVAPADGETFLPLVARLMELRAQGGVHLRAHRPMLERSLAKAIARLDVEHSHALVWSRRHALPKLDESQTNTVIEIRGPAKGAVLLQLPATTFPVRGTLVESSPASGEGSSHRGLHRMVFDVPPMSLREYRGAVCAPGQLVKVGNALASDCYRKHHGFLKNRNTIELSPWFGVPKESLAPVGELAGTYFHLDSEHRGHFGHAMTEQLSRLWALEHARASYPDLKVLLGSQPSGPGIAQFERLLWGAADVPLEDLVVIEEPMRVERLLAATPMFEQPMYVHPDIARIWSRVSARLADAAPDRGYPQRLFCARRARHRTCRNAPEVEQLFVDAGFEVVFPEDFTLQEQARMFRDAEAIGGYAGSALFNICLTQTPKRVFMISSDSYTAKNEYLMAATMGHHLDIVWCRSETPMPEGVWSRRAFRSPFTLDMQHEGAFLRDRLRDLRPI